METLRLRATKELAESHKGKREMKPGDHLLAHLNSTGLTVLGTGI